MSLPPLDLHPAAEQQLALALSALAPWTPGQDQPPPWSASEAIHQARKAVKRLRALLRLNRSALGAAYKDEDTALRDLNRGLSAARDATAVLEALERLRAPDGGPDPALDSLRARLTVPHTEDEAPLGAALEALNALTEQARSWPLGERWGDLRAGLRLTFARGRRLFQRARRDRATEDLHAWRKEVKHLSFQLRVLSGAWPVVMEGWASELGVLADLLGEDHDLAVLHERLALAPEPGDEALYARFAERRGTLQDAALALGARLYAERPGAFTRRVGRWVRLGRRLPLQESTAPAPIDTPDPDNGDAAP